MASSSSKAPCTTCGNKAAGINRCEGCLNVFCRKHLNEHRDLLGHQLDEIVLEHDTLHQTIAENQSRQNHQYPILKEIDQWEKSSIAKIQQLAEETRQQVRKLSTSSSQTVSKELHDLAEQLQKARTNDDYVETDLRTWTNTLQRLKDDINTCSTSICMKEDRTEIIIGKMYISTRTKHSSRQIESFGQFFGDIRIDNNGLVATYCTLKYGNAYVRGKVEYSSGKHNIQFLFKKTLKYVTSFGIAPKLMPIDRKDQSFGYYQWSSDDTVYGAGDPQTVDKNFRDMQGQTEFQIELQLDCDNRKISYVNQRTKNRREMNVNIAKCPFPWQTEFYMFDVGDCVRLLP